MAKARTIEESSSTKIKFGYLSYSDMLARIADGQLDAYDVIYTKDTFLTYIISPELVPTELRSRVYIFNSVEEANIALNKATDTYAGQMVSIVSGDVCKAYIVNYIGGTYSVAPINDANYNSLSDVPIINLTGTLDDEIIISTLSSGTYKVSGQYKIYDGDSTVYLSVDGDLFLVYSNGTTKRIKRITSDSIYDFTISDDVKKSTFYITKEYLEGLGYVTKTYVDSENAALELSLKEYINEYVSAVVTEQIDSILDTKIDEKLEAKLQPTTADEVEDLFD